MKTIESMESAENENLQLVYDKPYLFDEYQPELLIEAQKHFKPELVIFQGILYGNRFFSSLDHPEEDARLHDGTVAYRILGYANSIGEAQLKIDGRTWPLDDSEPIVDWSKIIIPYA